MPDLTKKDVVISIFEMYHNSLYKKGIIKEDTFNELTDKYNFSKKQDNKGKDDYEIDRNYDMMLIDDSKGVLI